MNSKDKKIGFVGVGRMGANMARNLKEKGYQISCVNDVDKDIAGALAEELGCKHANTLAGVTAKSDIILTVVTNDAAMEAIFLTLMIICSKKQQANFLSTALPSLLQCTLSWKIKLLR